jgi:hypothetical protein
MSSFIRVAFQRFHYHFSVSSKPPLTLKDVISRVTMEFSEDYSNVNIFDCNRNLINPFTYKRHLGSAPKSHATCGNFSQGAGMSGTERDIAFSQLAVKGLRERG